MQRESEVLRSFLRFDIGGADSDGEAGSAAPASRRRPRSQPLPVPMEGGKKLSPFQQIMREIKMKRNAANSRASRSRRSRRVVQEEEYTDKDRAAAANMGSRDIKQSLRLKRKQERSRALQIPEEARPGALLALGSREMRRGNLRTAIGFVHKALELNPRDKNALVCRSKCHLLMGEPQLALHDAEAALRIDKNFVKAIFQKAEALYNTGDFEHSLMFYHRGQRLRPELDAFRLGVQKTQQAIQNTIGQALTGPEARRALRCQSARRPSEEEASSGGGGGGSGATSTGPASRSGSGASGGGGSRSRERARSPSGRRLLGELCVDKEYLEQLLQNPDINSLQPNGASIIAAEAEEAVSFLKTRQEFWRQQYPISINASKLKTHRN
ncbi:outer dynein arm-docking complex subunit 4-like [Schistocerca piceifrons]|uniref:outer dynein arm-docking complex subunit 4-like n=2 Tax=Schistocerca TaxID=7008 RepID=UPI001F5E9F21|nr:outer dynein arm-docking complex subunit 4-like [Schistocerca piceifrons]